MFTILVAMEMLLGGSVTLMFEETKILSLWMVSKRKTMMRTVPINKLETSFLATQEYSARS